MTKAWTLLVVMLIVGLAPAPACAGPDLVVVDRDDVEVRESCTVRFGAAPIVDDEGDGVVRITGAGVVIRFEGVLNGAPADVDPDGYTGCGVRVLAPDVALHGPVVRGFKVGVHATGAHGLLVEGADLSGNFRQRLRSTAQAEDGADWLWPHENDGNEWIERYGAALCVEQSDGITVRGVRVREGQNGIVLDEVTGGLVYDNDCSFLSGWGLAMWRSSANVVARNAFDFCVRGYSHGVYNRGQDSAGILMFEQCSNNVIAENSATHCGDGIFIFAGREALGERDPRPEQAWYERRGCNDNAIVGNDCSDAVAHGLEVTFSFGNSIWSNRFAGNAICGIWGGYSREMVIGGNRFAGNGAMGYGAERGGINIEHGRDNMIIENTFAANTCGIFLWWDEDERLAALPWAAANGVASEANRIEGNTFAGDTVGVQLRRSSDTVLAGNSIEAGVAIDADEPSLATLVHEARGADRRMQRPRLASLPGEQRPVGARAELAGRQHIVMTGWGPYDWQRPLLQRVEASGARHVYELLGPAALDSAALEQNGPRVALQRQGDRLVVTTDATGAALPYRLRAATGAGEIVAEGVLLPVTWQVRAFAWRTDPREDLEAWRAEAAEGAVTVEFPQLELHYGNGGPSALPGAPPALTAAALPADRFGTIARTTMELPAGRWVLRTRSDDGIRVLLDGAPVIEDWTWHAPKAHAHEIEITEGGRRLEIVVEHFELDGFAVLEVEVARE